MKTEIVLPDLREIEFQLQTKDVDVIQQYVREIKPPNCYVEIGTKYGGGALVARHATKEGVIVYTIDPNPEGFLTKENQEKLEKVGVVCIKKLSLEAARDWDKPIGVLFIDGDHEMAGVDFGAWEKYLIPDAIILFHDYAVHSPTVIADCKGIVRNDRHYKVIYAPPLESRIETSILIMQKL